MTTVPLPPSVERDHLADDPCECGHPRLLRYAPSGATVGCQGRQYPLPIDLGGYPCPCAAYGREGATGRPQR